MTAAEVLESKRQEAGAPSFAKITRSVLRWLGEDFATTEETVRTYHRAVPRRVDPLILMAIADYYGLTLSDLGYSAPKDLSDLVIRASRCNLRTPVGAAV